jgi:hypothetical protein
MRSCACRDGPGDGNLLAAAPPPLSHLFMRHLAATLLIALASHAASAAEIARLWTNWRDAKEFVSISEFFTGREHSGGEIVLRSQDDARAGYYFTVRIRKASTIASLRLEVVYPRSSEPRTFSWNLSKAPRASQVFLIGLTGQDWPDQRARPLAWRLTAFDAAGTPLATDQSFLWSMPAE